MEFPDELRETIPVNDLGRVVCIKGRVIVGVPVKWEKIAHRLIDPPKNLPENISSWEV